ncbi:MAG: glycosyltransferase [Desulfobacterales bacterium]
MNSRQIPTVSVIIPTFNRGWVIREAIDSVLNQTFGSFELIVVDDGSTDNTLDILAEYKDRITLIKQRNRGVSAARNRGMDAASGQFIAFLDSDDLWLPQKLKRQMEFFDSNPDALICQTEETWIRDAVRVNPGKRHRKVSGMIFEPSLHLCLVSPSAVMIKRSLFEEVGLFDESLPACEDYDMWLRVGYKHSIFLIDTPLIIKRGGHADQLSKNPALDKYRIKALKKILDQNVLSEKQHRAAVKVLKEKCSVYAAGCQKRGRTEEAGFYLTLFKQYEAL